MSRGNTEPLTILPSAARPVVTKSTDWSDVGAIGGIFHFNVTTVTSAPTVGPTFVVEGRESITGKYYTLAQVGTTDSTSTGIRRIGIYPGISTASISSSGILEQNNVSFPLPFTWRVTSTSASTGEITYSVSVDLIR